VLAQQMMYEGVQERDGGAQYRGGRTTMMSMATARARARELVWRVPGAVTKFQAEEGVQGRS
jgi:hypothetical protein